MPPPAETLSEVDRLQAALAQSQQNLHAAEIKIQALTLELAHHKRLRFGQKSEALARGQADLFNETAQIDQPTRSGTCTRRYAPMLGAPIKNRPEAVLSAVFFNRSFSYRFYRRVSLSL